VAGLLERFAHLKEKARARTGEVFPIIVIQEAVERARSADERGAITVASIERGVPMLVSARDLVERFHSMVRDRDPDALPAWITDAAGSVLASFGKGIVADQAAVLAALTQPWSNGQTEGQITRLKLVKRQMYGRAKLDLLRARLIVPA
jgi:transposase